ncbi:hypothetical protein AX16_006618 [Volvariella volvacea WC 439]|nr:hypothetical protein AX16_006618 [Volvariella volvacea WC 439]
MNAQIDPRLNTLNLDVLEEIFLHLAVNLQDTDADWGTARRELLSISLLCRQFTEPALRVLWRSMSSLVPLFKLLPLDLSRQGDGKYVLSSSIPKESWSRFEYYARKIRHFRYGPENSGIEISPATYGYIARVRGVTTLLPNLRCLYIDQRRLSSLRDFECLLPFIAEWALQRVEVWSTNSSCSQPDLFPSLSIIRLLSMNVHTISIHGHVSEKALDTICYFSNLRRVEFSPGEGDHAKTTTISHTKFLTELAMVPRLQELSFDLRGCDCSQLFSLNFGCLKHIHLRGDLKSIMRIIRDIKSTSLVEVELDIECIRTQQRTSGWVESLVSTISKKWARSITLLRISDCCSYHAECSGRDSPVSSLTTDDLRLSSLILSPQSPVSAHFAIATATAATGAPKMALVYFPFLEHLRLPPYISCFSLRCP